MPAVRDGARCARHCVAGEMLASIGVADLALLQQQVPEVRYPGHWQRMLCWAVAVAVGRSRG